MHELSITRNIVAAVVERAAGKRVTRVKLVVGELTGVEVQAVRFCFDICAAGTVLEGAVLEVEEVPGLGRCPRCGREVALHAPILRCECAPDAVLGIVRGEELLVRSMEVSDV